MQSIPTYGPDGRRTRSFSLEAIERLLARSLVTVRRNRKGVITRAHFRSPDGGHALLATCHMGQKYCVEGSSGPLHWWEFRDFLCREDRDWFRANESADIERYLQTIFRAVPLSCLTAAKPDPAPAPAPVAAAPRRAKVVSIDAFRKRRPATLVHEQQTLAA